MDLTSLKQRDIPMMIFSAAPVRCVFSVSTNQKIVYTQGDIPALQKFLMAKENEGRRASF